MGAVIGIIVVAIVVLVVVALAFFVIQRRRAEQASRAGALRERFGPEYDRAVQAYGSEDAAQSALAAREERVKRLTIRSLSDTERARFSKAWTACQARFVDDPATAIGEADRLVAEVMQARGYPVGDFEQQASSVSVEHPDVVEHYRAAHGIALRQQEGQTNTEDLRQAMVHYRALFATLLEVPESQTLSIE